MFSGRFLQPLNIENFSMFSGRFLQQQRKLNSVLYFTLVYRFVYDMYLAYLPGSTMLNATK